MGTFNSREEAEREIPKVTILCGGNSNEHEISILSGKNVQKILEKSKVKTKLFVWNGDFRELRKVNSPCFIALHGSPGEDGKVQKYFEDRNVKYTGSDPHACEITFDKIKTKEFFTKNDIKTPKWWKKCKKLPCILKPRYGGSSIGVKLCFTKDECTLTCDKKEEYFFEEYVDGREISVSVVEIGGEVTVLPILEIIPSNTFYDYEAKYTKGGAKLIAPAPLSDEEKSQIAETAKKIYIGLHLRDYARIDGIISKDGVYFLEVNSIPGMTELSDLPASARAGKVFMEEILVSAIESSMRR